MDVAILSPTLGISKIWTLLNNYFPFAALDFFFSLQLPVVLENMDTFLDNNVTVNSSIDKWPFNGRTSRQHLDPGEMRVLIPVLLGIICALGVACNLTAMFILLSNAHKGKLSLIDPF